MHMMDQSILSSLDPHNKESRVGQAEQNEPTQLEMGPSRSGRSVPRLNRGRSNTTLMGKVHILLAYSQALLGKHHQQRPGFPA